MLIKTISVLGLLCLASCASAPKNPWGAIKTPTLGQAEVIGTYTAGCLAGAASMHADGPGYQLMRLSRGRFYGHSSLVQFIEQFGKKVARRKLGQVLVGNLGQPRGGPTLVGHRSHQVGLDVDMWYWQPAEANAKNPRRLTLGEREIFESPSVVTADGLSVNANVWTPQMMAVLKAAAEFEDVERIFVHAAIKKELCEKAAGQKWLTKMRPWWGHDDHFHVRLKCPEDQPHCQKQDPVADSDECDSNLEWWFSEEALQKAREMNEKPSEPVMPTLPEACEKVILN